MKISLILTAELQKMVPSLAQVYADTWPNMITTTAYFRSEAEPILNVGNINGALAKAKAQILRRLEEMK